MSRLSRYRLLWAAPLLTAASAAGAYAPGEPPPADRVSASAETYSALERGDLASAWAGAEAALANCVPTASQQDRCFDLHLLATGLLALLDRLDEAEAHANKAVAIAERTFAKDHPDLARAQSNLGSLLVGRDSAALAEPYFRKALEILTRGGEAPREDVGTVYGGLAQSLHAQARYAEAEEAAEKAVAIRRETVGPDDPATAAAHVVIGRILLARDRYAEGLAHFADARRIADLHGDTRLAQQAILARSLALQLTRRVAEAEAAAREALALAAASDGEQHSDVADAYLNLGASIEQQGRPEDALPYYEEAVRILSRARGERNDRTAFARQSFARALFVTKAHPAAEDNMRRALAALRATRGEDHPLTANASTDLGALLLRLGRNEEAVRYLRAAYATYSKRSNRSGEAIVLFNLAGAAWGKDGAAAAEPLLRHALRLSEDTGPAELLRERKIALASAWLTLRRNSGQAYALADSVTREIVRENGFIPLTDAVAAGGFATPLKDAFRLQVRLAWAAAEATR